MKTKLMMLNELEELNVFTQSEYTYPEYVEQLKNLQNYVVKEIFNEEYHHSLRINDALYKLKMECIQHDLVDLNEFKNCENAMNIINKEISISISGKRGEDKVNSHLRKYVDRPEYKNYRNIVLSDEDEDTELDNLILTDNGLIILEVKKVNSDITIDETGRLFYGRDVSYDKETLALKMKRKRRLLRDNLQKIITSKGYNLNIHLDSYIVFTSKLETQFHIRDLYKKENWCTSKKLTYIVNEYTSDYKYTQTELDMLNECILSLEKKEKRFETQDDFSKIKDNITTLLELLNEKKEAMARERALKTKYETRKKVARNMMKMAVAFASPLAFVVVTMYSKIK